MQNMVFHKKQVSNYGQMIEFFFCLLSYLVLLVFYYYFLNQILKHEYSTLDICSQEMKCKYLPPSKMVAYNYTSRLQNWLLLSELLVLWTVISELISLESPPLQIACHSLQNWNVMMLRGTFKRRSNNGYIVLLFWGLILERQKCYFFFITLQQMWRGQHN